MAVITIDGTRLEVPEGKNVLDCAAGSNGIYLPHLALTGPAGKRVLPDVRSGSGRKRTGRGGPVC